MRSVRSGDSVRQLTLLNLGSHFEVPPTQWPALCQLIDADPQLLPVAQRLASTAPAEPADNDLALVHLDSLANRRGRSVGAERLALHALEDLGFTTTLQSLGVSSRQARLATALVVARMLHPSSERAAHAWLTDCSATLELLGLSGSPPSLSRLYRLTDLLWQHRKALENALFQREREILQLPDTIVSYDLTNVHYHGRPRDDLRHGRSQQKRNDCPLVTLAMSLDETGFPCHSEILPGNVSEPATLAAALERLGALRGDRPRPTVVMDAGLSTQAPLASLRERGYDWISVRRGKQDPPAEAPELEFPTRKGTKARVWRLRRAEGESESGAEGERETGGQSELCNREGAAWRRCQPERATAVRFERNAQHARKDARAGTYVLRTSHGDWDLERIVRTCWQLTDIEATFRTLKSEIGLRPIWHARKDRIRSHLFIAVRAYHGVHLLRRRLREHEITDSWTTIRHKLASWERITTTLETDTGEQIVCRQDSRPDPPAAALARAAGVTPGLHRIRTRTPAVCRRRSVRNPAVP